MIPSIKELVMYVNKKLTELDWNNNFQKIVNWLTSGKYDIKVKSVEISQDGGLVNNGSLTQNGNFTVEGNAEITGNVSIGGTLTGDGSGLTGVVSAAQISYTPFCVNSGNLDSNGKGDIFYYTEDVSTSIQFKVGDGTTYKPITFTNAKGKTVTLNSINSYDLSQTDNGTYIVYITENATAVTLTDNGRTIFRQPYAPTVEQAPQPSDIWLDTSSEGLKSYIRQSGTWVEANIVPLGKVEIANHTIHSAETFEYNYNSYNLVNNYSNQLNMATGLCPDMSTEVSILNTNVQYTEKTIWLKVQTTSNDMGSATTIKMGVASDNLDQTLYSQYYTGASLGLTFWLLVPAKTYFQLSSTSYVGTLNKYEILGNTKNFYTKI